MSHQENNVLNSYMSIIVLISFNIKEIVCNKKSMELKRKKHFTYKSNNRHKMNILVPSQSFCPKATRELLLPWDKGQ